MISDLFTQTGALFSPDKRYRYRLWRTWDASRPPLVMVMLNPSIADAERNDPTVERCQRRAVAMGLGKLEVTNIFALVSTDPAGLYSSDDPIGPGNDRAILDAVSAPGAVVICAWGTHGDFQDRGKAVVDLLRGAGITPYCLGLNQNGSPKHPLYLRNDIEPLPFSGF